MTNEKIDYIAEDHLTMIELEVSTGSSWAEREPNEVPESMYAQYMNHLIDQIQLCWEVIRNKEAKQ